MKESEKYEIMDKIIEKKTGWKAAFTKKGPGVFMFPGLFKIAKKEVAKRPAQKNVLNRLTGEVRDVPARPAYNKPKLTALKALKDIVKNGK